MTAMGGRATLGQATGSIVLDLSQLKGAQLAVQQVGQQMQVALSGIPQTAQQGVSSVAKLGEGIRSLRTELTAVGAASGLLAGFGINEARNLRNYTVAFRSLVGSQQEALKVMQGLEDSANKFGLDLGEVFQLGRSLLPILKGNTSELDKWVLRAAELRSVFPAAQTGGETRAIAEFLAGQTMSLQRLFNIPPALIAQAKAQFSDLGDQLDFILAKMGATEASALQMANGFQSLKNSISLLLATGFGPLFERLNANALSMAHWLDQLRATNPELLNLGAGITAGTAAAAASILVLGQLADAYTKLKTAGLIGGAARIAGPLAEVGIGAAIGGAAGMGIGNTVRQAQGKDPMSVAQVWETMSVSVRNHSEILVAMFARLSTSTKNASTTVTSTFVHGIGVMTEAMGRFVHFIAGIIPGGGGIAGAGLAMQTGGVALQGQADELLKQIDQNNADLAEFLRGLPAAFGLVTPMGPPRQPGVGLPAAAEGMTPEQNQAILDWATGVQKIETDANEARLQATQQYESQRTQTIRQYELNLARDAEDYARQQARQAASLQQNIDQIRQDGAERQAQLVENSNKQLAKIQDDFARQQQRAAQDHRLRLMDAAGRLDAVAVAQEQRNYAEHTQQANEDQQSRIQQEQDTLQESLKAQQEADQKRIEQAQRNYDEQQRLQNEDHALRLQRMAEDHRAQLDEMDRQQGERLAQIDRQAAQQRQALDQAFAVQMKSLGIVVSDAWQRIQDTIQAGAIASFTAWKTQFDNLQKSISSTAGWTLTTGPKPQTFADGGPVGRTGLALLHAGEYVMNRAMVAAAGGPNMVSHSRSVALSRQRSSSLGEAPDIAAARGSWSTCCRRWSRSKKPVIIEQRSGMRSPGRRHHSRGRCASTRWGALRVNP